MKNFQLEKAKSGKEAISSKLALYIKKEQNSTYFVLFDADEVLGLLRDKPSNKLFDPLPLHIFKGYIQLEKQYYGKAYGALQVSRAAADDKQGPGSSIRCWTALANIFNLSLTDLKPGLRFVQSFQSCAGPDQGFDRPCRLQDRLLFPWQVQ